MEKFVPLIVTAHQVNIVVLTAKMANVAINVTQMTTVLLGNVVVMLIDVQPYLVTKDLKQFIYSW